ncbi:hypothetical protein ACLBYG_08225 [Methylobacterium sp. D53M]
MTDHDAPSGANEPGCALTPTGLWVRAQVRQSRRHRDGLLLALEPLDPHRPGRLSAVLSGPFLRQIEAASGVLLDPDHLVGEHTLLLTLVVDPLLGLTGQVLGLERGAFLQAWREQDRIAQAALEADGLWDRQRGFPVPQKLRRVVLIEPDDAAPHPIGATLARWYEQGLIELIRLPVAYEEPGSVAALHEAFAAVYDQWDWGTLDAVVVEPGLGFAHRALSDEGLMRRIAVLPVPVLFRRVSAPTLIDGVAFRACDTAEALLADLTEILRGELRTGGYVRLAAIARALGPDPVATAPASASEAPTDPGPTRQGPLFD